VQSSCEWIVLELNTRSEGEDPDSIRQSIRSTVKNAEVFVPAAVTQVGEDRVVHYLVDGYAFVRRAEPDSTYLKLEGSRYVQAVLIEPGMTGKRRRLATVKDKDIAKMQGQIDNEVDQGIGVGDVVRVTSGAYRNMDATVIEEIPEQGMVQVFVRLRSKQSLITLPRSFLRVVERAPLSPVFTRLFALKTWTKAARPILLWPDNRFDAIRRTYRKFEKHSKWLTKGGHLWALIGLAEGVYDNRIVEVKRRFRGLVRLNTWTNSLGVLWPFVAAYQGFIEESRVAELNARLLRISWLDDVMDRLKVFANSLETLSQDLTQVEDGDEDMYQNVVIDGHNLLFRCFYAPGMAELCDSKGRRTGLILGFLRSLGSLKKRFPGANLYVTWDGSSRRRKDKFADYKANRPKTTDPVPEDDPVFMQSQFIRSILPQLSVRQATNPVEEADDIIAALVRGPLKGQKNLIFSSDRDLLQLVSETTHVLAPGAGTRKEVLYDPSEVESDYGVTPSKMVQLRAFYGDSSDNIPGVPRVPKKVLRSLLQAHGSIDGVYGSGLTGLTKGQYERLRSGEPQVRINAELMSLVDVAVSVQDPDVDPEGAASRLREREVNPTPILESFFGKSEAASP
jgi:5'-3' exonuclease